MPCIYVYGPPPCVEKQPPPPPQEPPSSNGPYYAHSEPNSVLNQDLDPILELRLMHEWTAHSSKTFSPTWEFWCYQAPLIALEFRYLLDAMFAMAALHASKQPPSQWNPIEGRSEFASQRLEHIANTDLTPCQSHADLKARIRPESGSSLETTPKEVDHARRRECYQRVCW